MKRMRNIILAFGCLIVISNGQYAGADSPPYYGAEDYHSETVTEDIGLAHELSESYIDPEGGYIFHNALTATGAFGGASIAVQDSIRSSYFTVPSTGDYTVTINVSVRGRYVNAYSSFFISHTMGATTFLLLSDIVGSNFEHNGISNCYAKT